MSHQPELEQFQQEIASHLGHLSNCWIRVLSLYVFGLVMVRHCGQTQIAVFLSELLGCRYGSLKQRLRELRVPVSKSSP